MAEVLGKEGQVVEVMASSGDVRVKFANQRTYVFNPRVRAPVGRSRWMMPPLN